MNNDHIIDFVGCQHIIKTWTIGLFFS